ncbi:MAG TPA: hypothetical protein VGC62_05530 [Pseudomonas sp.]|uniref:hypothetical protein n=1 Tax=Pseudomonas sp. TaxID=306 RepID=UPI002ED83E53
MNAHKKIGDLDPSFGEGGKLVYPGTGIFDSGLKSLPDGKFIAVGWSADKASEVLVVKLMSDGKTDTGFGEQGIIREILIEDAEYSAARGCVHEDGSITVFATQRIDNSHSVIWAARFNPDGSRNTSFGLLEVSNETAENRIGGVCLQADGKILVTVYEVPGFNVLHPFVTRINEDGTRDTTFGLNGSQYFSDEVSFWVKL